MSDMMGKPGVQAKGTPGSKLSGGREKPDLETAGEPQDASLSKGPNPRVECEPGESLGSGGGNH